MRACVCITRRVTNVANVRCPLNWPDVHFFLVKCEVSFFLCVCVASVVFSDRQTYTRKYLVQLPLTCCEEMNGIFPFIIDLFI